MKKVMRPNYKNIRQSIIDSLQSNYTQYKLNHEKYLSLTWYNDEGIFCQMNGCEEALHKANDFLGKVSNDIILLDICNKILEEIESAEDNDYRPLSSNEEELLKLINFM